jgi:pyridoxamine 5'-phosphate oxidase
LRRQDLPEGPLELFRAWHDAAVEHGSFEPPAVAVATTGPRGTPSLRMVLLRGFDERGFVFYTNYNSRKAEHIKATPDAAMMIWWKAFDRQVRIEGRVKRTSEQESDAYFATRPRGHQVGAWVSDQSKPISGRAALEKRQKEFEERYREGDVPRPPHWGGFRIVPEHIEFWQARRDRLHDRFLYTREQDTCTWRIQRLSP